VMISLLASSQLNLLNDRPSELPVMSGMW